MKYKKKWIFGFLALCVSQICFFNFGGIGIENNVFADDTVQQTVDFQGKAKEKTQEFVFIEKMIYLLIYPMLVIAGNLVDNSLVYGASFGFDVVLWELRNIMRNLANFTLGFIFVYKIFKYLISGQKKDDIKNLLVSLLIAGIGIQASWFIMATLIDMSTILTYGVGGLPISILKDAIGKQGKDNQIDNSKDPFVLKTIVNVDVDNIEQSTIYLTNTIGDHFYISECETIEYKNRELLLAPKMIYFEYYEGSGKVYKQTISTGCHLGGQVYYFSDLYDGINKDSRRCEGEKCKTEAQGVYNNSLTDAKSAINGKGESDIISSISEGKLLELGNIHITGGIQGGLWTGTISNPAVGLDVNNEITAGDGKTERLHDILNDESYVGVFSILYSSLINAGQGIIVNAGGVFERLLVIVLSLGHSIAIAIPLIVVGIIFMIRIGILWIAIVISPFIAILTAFKDLGDKIKENIKFLDYFNLGNLLKIIFAPVIVCLAISLSTVLVTIITNINFSGIVGNEILGGLIKLDLSGVSVVIGRFIGALFGIAITWFLVWAAVESSKIGKMGFVQSLKNLAESSIGSLPIVPIPKKEGGVEFIGTKSAFGENGIISTIGNKIENEFNTKDSEAIEELINREKKSKEAGENRVRTYKSKLLNRTAIPENRTAKPIEVGETGNEIGITFNQLSETSKIAVIDGINGIEDVEKRKAFGKSEPTITFKDETGKDIKYNFEKNVNKYQKEGS